ncbi:hypothetical protein Hypma_005944 [Hypsizygus marmoreus]|uniref:Uncharacterized protein n=1 Tax=Hypsizygus marmoreus TaxID=39966 RepID=A0A369KG58_HYPMA|nr:hypothetical protein Hypma_005944 [Hypsizygus marmoreus]
MVSELFIHNLPANVQDFDVERALRECKDSASGIFVASVHSEGPDHRITRIAFSSNVEAENALRHRIFRITDVQPEVEFEVTSTPPEDQPPSLLKTTLGRLATLLPIVFSAFDWDDCLQPSEPTLSKTIENPLPDTKGIQADIPCHLEGEVVNELDNHSDLDAARIESAYVQLQAKHHQTMDALKRAEANAKMYRGKYYLRRKECLSVMRSQKTFRSHRPPSRIRSSRKPSNDQRIREDEEARTLVSFIRLLEEVEDTRVEINPKSDQLKEMAAEAKEKVKQAFLDNKVLRARMREQDAAEETRRANQTEMQAVIKSLRESQVTTQATLEGAHLNAQNLESDLRKAKTRAQGAFNRLRKLKSMYSQLDIGFTRATKEAKRVKNDVQILEGERTAWRGECLILKSQSDILRLQLLMSAKNLDILRAELEQVNRTANLAAEQEKKMRGEHDELQKRLDEELCKARKARNVRDVLRAELEQTNRTANLAVTQKQEMRGERDELQKRLDEELCKARKDRDVHRAELEQANRTANLALEQQEKMTGERDELQTYKSWAEPTLLEKNQAIQDLKSQFDESRLEAFLLNTRVDLLETENGELRGELQARDDREQMTQAEELKRVRELHQCRIQLQAMEGLKNALRAELNESQRTVLDFRLKEAASLMREEKTQRAHKDALDECHRRIRALQAEIDAKDEARRQHHRTSNPEGDKNAKRKTPEQSQEERRSQWKKAAQTEKERCRQRDSQWTSGSDEWTPATAVQRFRSVLAEFETMTFSEACPLTFEAIPWPVLHRPGVFSVQQVDWAAVEGFCKHLKKESGDGYKALFKRVQVTFHPDKWRSRNILSTVMEEGLRKELEAAGSIVAQQVNGCL